MTESKSPAPHILIVEDDVDLAEMLSAYFRVQTYVVDIATWGEDAIQFVHKKIPDLILLDIRLPDFDGFEVCRRLRAMHRTRHIPIIFLTEKRDRKDKLSGLELGAVDYITKPFDIKELHLRIRNSLRRAKLTNNQNPVTGFPEGDLVLDRLQEMLAGDDWGLVYAGIHHLHQFRDQFGFVASDDVMRAVSLMLQNALDESDDDNSFIGHVDENGFVLITSSKKCQELASGVEERLSTAIPYFYPATLLAQAKPEQPRLTAIIHTLTPQKGHYQTVQDIRNALNN
jgi:PleD family two-component response regulator